MMNANRKPRKLKDSLKQILTYKNPDPRCHYPFEPNFIGYCWSYAHHVDGTPGFEDMSKICPGCDMFKKANKKAEKQLEKARSFASKKKNPKCECGHDSISLDLFTPGGVKNLCANCAVTAALLKEPTLSTILKGTCAACDSQNVVGIVHDFKFDKKHTDVEYPVCHEHFRAIFLNNLTPEEYARLRKLNGITFNIHDDFYTDDGEAVQPKTERE